MSSETNPKCQKCHRPMNMGNSPNPHECTETDDDDGVCEAYARIESLKQELQGANVSIKQWSKTNKELVKEIDTLTAKLADSKMNHEPCCSAVTGLGECNCSARQTTTHNPEKARPGIGMPASIYLHQFGDILFRAFGEVPYQVGSSLMAKTWRDVDVRIILGDEDYEESEFGDPKNPHLSPKWCALVQAFSELGRKITGLPIDFQIQQMTEANTNHKGHRSALVLGTLRRQAVKEKQTSLDEWDARPSSERKCCSCDQSASIYRPNTERYYCAECAKQIDNAKPKKERNDWCQGIEIRPGEYSGCACDCPACHKAHKDVEILQKLLLSDRANISDLNQRLVDRTQAYEQKDAKQLQIIRNAIAVASVMGSCKVEHKSWCGIKHHTDGCTCGLLRAQMAWDEFRVMNTEFFEPKPKHPLA